jgi:Sec-independent protein translocase protein TatA
MGFGTGFLLLIVIGFLVLGPKRMREVLMQIAKAKADLRRSTREIQSHLTAEIDGETGPRN